MAKMTKSSSNSDRKMTGIGSNQDESSDSDGETEPAKIFHRRISTNKDIKTSTCIKDGMLYKQTVSFNRWKKRYFKLKQRRLYYAKDRKSGIFNEIDISNLSVAECSIRNINHSFQVITPSRNIIICAGSRRCMEEWIAALKMASNKEYYEEGQTSHIEVMSGQHNWYACSHARPTYCNVCREALPGVTSHGLSCEVCKFKAHKRCAVRAPTNCKWTSLSSIGKDIIEDEEGIWMPHQWMEGNLPVSAKCSVCDKTCGSVLRLQDWRCLWCRAMVHAGCLDQMTSQCPLGQCRLSILPPTSITSIDSDGYWEGTRPQGTSPLLVYVNTKSGDNQGVKFLRRFKQLLNPAQVFDLMNGGPYPGLKLFQRFDSFRILICGGDGSIGWVLAEIDRLDLHRQCQVGVLPFGTGNDLARVLGWGSAFDDDTQLPAALEKLEHAQIKMLDRWSIWTYEGTMPPPRKLSMQNDAMSQYEDSMANHLTKILHSEDHQAVISSARVLCETVKAFVDKVSKSNLLGVEEGGGEKGEGGGGGDDAIGVKFEVLNEKLQSLLNTLYKESEEVRESSENKEGEEKEDAKEILAPTSSSPQAPLSSPSLTQQPSLSSSSALKDEGEVTTTTTATSTVTIDPEGSSSLQGENNKETTTKTSSSSSQQPQPSTAATSGDEDGCGIPEGLSSQMKPKPVFKSKDALMSRANSLKKAVRQIIEHAEKAVDEQNALAMAAEGGGGSIVMDPSAPTAFQPHNPHMGSLMKSIEGSRSAPSFSVFSQEPSPLAATAASTTTTNSNTTTTTSNTITPSSSISPSSSLLSSTMTTAVTTITTDSNTNDTTTTASSSAAAGISSSSSSALLKPGALPAEGEPPSSVSLRASAGSRSPLLSSPSSRRISSMSTFNRSASLDSKLGLAAGTTKSSQELDRLGDHPNQPPYAATQDNKNQSQHQTSSSSISTQQQSQNQSQGQQPAASPPLPFGRSLLHPAINLPGISSSIAKNLSGGGFISKVLLANADALCAAASPLLEQDIPLESYQEKCVMNNYFGIGLDAKVTLEFQNKREEHPEKCRSRTKNMMWYGVLGSKEMFHKTFKNLDQRVLLECDGQRIPLPRLQGIVILNIPSYCGGANFWGGSKQDENFTAPSFDDRILEVVAVFGGMQIAMSRVIDLQHHRIAQCRSVKVTILGDEGVPVQVDGEAWIQPPGYVRIVHKNRAQMLIRDRTFESVLKSWSEKQKLDRPASPQLLALTEEEMQTLINFIEATSSVLRSITVASKAYPAIEQDLLPIVQRATECVDRLHPISKLAEADSSDSDYQPIQKGHVEELVQTVRVLYHEASYFLTEKASNITLSESMEDRLTTSLISLQHELKRVLEILGPIHLEPMEEINLIEHQKRKQGKIFKQMYSKLKGRAKEKGRGNRPPAFEIRSWTLEEVGQWLESLSLTQYKESFKTHEIRGAELLNLERRDLKDLGVTKIGHLKRLQHAIKELQHREAAYDRPLS